jgi:hypothetical protein
MTPVTDEITFKITYDEYLIYYEEVCDTQKTYKAFGKDWFVVCLEAKGSPSGFHNPYDPQYFITFRLAI